MLKIIIASETTEQLMEKCRLYSIEYDQVEYFKGYVVPKLNAFLGIENLWQHLAQFKANCDNTRGNDALMSRQFVNNFNNIVFEWYFKLLNGLVKTFVELETLFHMRFVGKMKKVTILDFTLENRRKDESH